MNTISMNLLKLQDAARDLDMQHRDRQKHIHSLLTELTAWYIELKKSKQYSEADKLRKILLEAKVELVLINQVPGYENPYQFTYKTDYLLT